MAQPLPVMFLADADGDWQVERISPVSGECLLPASGLTMIEGDSEADADSGVWCLRGVTSNPRYTIGAELKKLTSVSPLLGRREASCAALIPIKKSEVWWAMAQDERRAVFEESSHHIARSIKYLPAVARRLHHARDLGEPFDFLTWFEFAPEHRNAFEDLVGELRNTEEWIYVEREVDVRLARD